MSTTTDPAGLTARRSLRVGSDHPSYKWLVPSNTTLSMLLSTINASILPPVGTLFAALLGFNPIAELLGPSGVLKNPGSTHTC